MQLTKLLALEAVIPSATAEITEFCGLWEEARDPKERDHGYQSMGS